MIPKAVKRLAPRPKVDTTGKPKAQKITKPSGSFRRLVIDGEAPDEFNFVVAAVLREVPIPVLTELAGIDGVEQIGRGSPHLFIAEGTEVWQRNLLYRRLREKEESDRRMGRLGEVPKLAHRWGQLSALPLPKLREALGE